MADTLRNLHLNRKQGSLLIVPSWKNEQKKKRLQIEVSFFLLQLSSHTVSGSSADSFLAACFRQIQKMFSDLYRMKACALFEVIILFPYKMKMYEKEDFCFFVIAGDN